MRPTQLFAVLFFLALSWKCHGEAADQCPAQQPIYGKALKGFTFKSLVSPTAFGCLVDCHYEDRCQSYNYVMKTNICEMNNRTKEAKPEQFVSDPDRFYVKRGAHRKQLGSIPALTAQSCKEIKANEGGQAVSSNSWLDPSGSGNVILAYCDMNTEVADFCIRHRCQNGASCVNGHVNYTCLCNGGWTGTHCDSSMTGTSCKEIKDVFPHARDGMYHVQPENGLSVLVYCDMTSFGGGWTMCYSTDDKVNLKTEVTYEENLPYGTNGYRTDCNYIPFREIMFVDETTGDKAIFTYKLSSTLVAAENYGTQLPELWIGRGVADTSYEYQLMICDHPFYSGFFVAGYTNNCYKGCEHWCGDSVSPFFRTATSSSQFGGVAFNVNGHGAYNNRLISAGLR
ncbi:uncharacterized protein LOC144647339 [Oculina patagonica]